MIPKRTITLLSGIPERGGIDLAEFDRRIATIQNVGFPASLDCVVVPALSTSGVFLDQEQIETIIFGCGDQSSGEDE